MKHDEPEAPCQDLAVNRSPPSPFAELARLPLREVVPALRARLDTITLAEVEALVQPMAAGVTSAPSSMAAVAAVVVGLPTPGSKLREIERAVIRHALEETDGNVSAAARLLGVDRKQLERKVSRYRLR
jgi:DNA-binding NtrC family response regulator